METKVLYTRPDGQRYEIQDNGDGTYHAAVPSSPAGHEVAMFDSMREAEAYLLGFIEAEPGVTKISDLDMGQAGTIICHDDDNGIVVMGMEWMSFSSGSPVAVTLSSPHMRSDEASSAHFQGYSWGQHHLRLVQLHGPCRVEAKTVKHVRVWLRRTEKVAYDIEVASNQEVSKRAIEVAESGQDPADSGGLEFEYLKSWSSE
jgi:hypothetical protein